MPAIYKDP
jgi:hypothetical protein